MTVPLKPGAFLAKQSQAQAELTLASLRRSFDERLSMLQGQSAATSLQSIIRGSAKLDGKVKAGSHAESRARQARTRLPEEI